MKIKILSLSALLTIAFLPLCLSVTSTPASPKNPAPAAIPAAAPSPAAAPAALPGSQHPEIREAIASLRRAKDHPEHAAHDFGGHTAWKPSKRRTKRSGNCRIRLKFDKD